MSVIRVLEEGLEKEIEVETDGVVGEEYEEVAELGGAILLGCAVGVGKVAATAVAGSAGDVGESTGDVGECASAMLSGARDTKGE